MQASDVRTEITRKRLEFDLASEAGSPQDELCKIYREIKTLQFQLLEREMAEKAEKSLTGMEGL